VLARNQIVQFATISQEAAFLPLSQRLNLITTEMRERVTKTRMQPIEQLFNKLPRMVREIALSCGKKVNLEVAGSETEIDRSILDAIKDPMTHAVRNAVDHGIERPEVRVGKGKPEYGTVRISAEHDSGYVVLKIKDDGAGLNPNALGNKAVERGLITREAVDKLNEAEVRDLIFLPGFSTASQVSNISGRGVGMDVVRTNVEKTGGTVELDSEFGSGTTLRFRIPLTLAIIPALMVECNGQAFALPQMSLVELVRIPQSEQDCVESIGDALVYRLRGRLLPLIVLSDLLSGVPSQPPSIGQEIVAIVLRFGSRHFGLIVEKVEDAEEIVVKPLGQLLSEVPLFSGATVRGDGKIALILDVNAIATSSRAFEKQHQGDLCEAPQEQIARRTRQLLYVDAGGRAAIEISHISRIEQLSPSQIESLHGKPVFQYQGRILPLIDLRSSDNDLRSSKNDLQSSDNPSTPVPVLVCEHNGQSAGVAVERVLDSAEEEITFDPESGDAVILQGAITHLLDMNALIENHCGGSQ
jgi:two-component system chemotaxis sensor kinase CheA